MNIEGFALSQKASGLLDDLLATPSHAILLSGPKGTGKTHIARSLAVQLLETAESALQSHPYYRVVSPQKGGIGIERVRELLQFFKLKVPGKGKIERVVVLEDAETMGTEAQNALLKLLEEPPAGSVLILTSSQPQNILATIRSRVQLVQLPITSATELEQHFLSQGYTAEASRAALLRAGTDIAEADRLLTARFETPDTSLALVKQALGATGYERLLMVDGLAKQKEAAHAFVDSLATVASASLQQAARKSSVNIGRWKNILQAAYTAQTAFERSGNAKLVLTELMLAL